MKLHIYVVSIVAAVAIATFVYGYAFDSLPETMLIGLTPLWFFPFIFGAYGFAAENLIRKVKQGRASSVAAAASIWVHFTGIIGLLPLLPLLCVKRSTNSLFVSFYASATWAALLLLFFVVLWPLL